MITTAALRIISLTMDVSTGVTLYCRRIYVLISIWWLSGLFFGMREVQFHILIYARVVRYQGRGKICTTFIRVRIRRANESRFTLNRSGFFFRRHRGVLYGHTSVIRVVFCRFFNFLLVFIDTMRFFSVTVVFLDRFVSSLIYSIEIFLMRMVQSFGR